MADDKFDEVLMQIAGQCGGIEPLFDTVFSFLVRKTDFFHIMRPGDKMGFAPGVAEKILLRSFKKYEAAANEASAIAIRRKEGPAAAKAAEAQIAAAKEAAAKEAAAKEAARPKGAVGKTKEAAAGAAPPPAAGEGDKGKGAPATDGKGDSGSGGSGAVPAAGEKLKKANLQWEAAPYNGGQCEGYSWEQTLHDLSIVVPVPEGTRAKDVICVIKRDRLCVQLRGQKPIIDAAYPCDARTNMEIWEKVRTSECTWNLGAVGGKTCITVYLEKDRETWWKSAVDGGAEIDTQKVDSVRDVYDYDNETQGAIRKIMFDQHQKRLGKPTSDEMKNEEMLRGAWDAEGSPFKGQPFDASKVSFSGAPPGAGGADGMAGAMMGGEEEVGAYTIE